MEAEEKQIKPEKYPNPYIVQESMKMVKIYSSRVVLVSRGFSNYLQKVYRDYWKSVAKTTDSRPWLSRVMHRLFCSVVLFTLWNMEEKKNVVGKHELYSTPLQTNLIQYTFLKLTSLWTRS